MGISKHYRLENNNSELLVYQKYADNTLKQGAIYSRHLTIRNDGPHGISFKDRQPHSINQWEFEDPKMEFPLNKCQTPTVSVEYEP